MRSFVAKRNKIHLKKKETHWSCQNFQQKKFQGHFEGWKFCFAAKRNELPSKITKPEVFTILTIPRS